MTNEEVKDKILIVDDVITNIKLAGAILKIEGFDIAYTTVSKESIEMIEKNDYDLVLLDIMMPEMDGFEVCEKIKENPKNADLPIIFISAKSEIDSVVKGFSLGAVDYVTKPFNSQELVMRIKTQLKIKKQRDELENQNKRLTELNDIKNRFLGMAAHDLRNPMTTIKGYAEIILMSNISEDTESIESYVRHIMQATDATQHILTDLLDFSAIESGKYSFNFQEYNLIDILKENIKFNAMISKKKNISIILENLLDDTVYITTDKPKFDQILNNLISNAVKFSNRDTLITVKCTKLSKNYLISVKDQGQGIAEDEIDKLFEPFTKTSTRSTAGEKSTGLGLAIVKKLVEGLDGKIYVQSNLGEGSEFSVSLPVYNR